MCCSADEPLRLTSPYSSLLAAASSAPSAGAAPADCGITGPDGTLADSRSSGNTRAVWSSEPVSAKWESPSWKTARARMES